MSAVVLSLLLIAGCDTGGPGTDRPEDDPSGEETTGVTSTTVTVQSDTIGLPGTLLEPDTNVAAPPINDLIAWIRNR